jgi:hypothetical protein
MVLWFTEPAKAFHETCPLGNGRLGAMDFGGTATLRIALNESSVWTGGPYDGNRYDAHKCLPRVRKRLFEGQQFPDLRGRYAILARAAVMPRVPQALAGRVARPPCFSTQTLAFAAVRL